LPDGDEPEHDQAEDPLMVEALMGWDGDPCACPTCVCPQFLDRADSTICRDCEAGRHRGPAK
jgi:hypothetical protein